MSNSTTSGRPPEYSLRDQLLQECEAMAKHAFASGLIVPGSIVQTIETAAVQKSIEDAKLADAEAEVPISRNGETAKGLALHGKPSDVLKQLARAHGQLSEIVAPATPRTILLLSTESSTGGLLAFLGPVKLIRKLMLVAILSLIGLVMVSLSPEVDGTVNWATESGLKLLLEELFLICAAAIGASFIALFQASRFIRDGTYDPKYDSSYWNRLVLGVIAGMILAMLIPFDPGGNLQELAKPTLAMLGGFSANVVYRILRRLVDTVESLVRGETRDLIAAQEREAKARAAEEIGQTRLKLAANLMGLQEKLGSGIDPEQLKQRLTQILNDLMPVELDDEQEAGTGTVQKENDMQS